MVQIRGAHKGYTVIVDADGSMKIYNKSKECVKYIPPAESGLAFFDVDTIKDVVEKYLEEEAKKRLQSRPFGSMRHRQGFKAKFTGTRTSCGFEPGKIYTLKSEVAQVLPLSRSCSLPMMCIVVYDADSIGRSCPYSSIEAFLRNWEIQSGPSDSNK